MQNSAPKRQRTDQDNEYTYFIRHASAEDKLAHKEAKKFGRKAQDTLRLNWKTTTVKNLSGSMERSSTEKQTKKTTRLYKNFWKIVEAEGGIVNKDFGIMVATNICKACEKKGPPFAMWDAAGGCMRYLHGEEGVDDEFVTVRKMLVKGEMDVPDEILSKALVAGHTTPSIQYGLFSMS